MNDNSILNSEKEIRSIDKSNMLGSLRELGLQISHAWQETQSVQFAQTAEIKNIVIAAMGGSGIGSDVILSSLSDDIKVPHIIINDYNLPQYTNQHTLVILSSYSGSTEEILSCLKQAQEKQAQIMIVASTGPLLEIAKENKYAHYHIIPTHNPSNQPRMAIGYSIAGIMGLLSHTDVFQVSQTTIDETLATLEKTVGQIDVGFPDSENQAKILAYLMLDRFPVFFGADFMKGSLHAATNQNNENAKAFANYFMIPEMNHHLLEGLVYPRLIQSSHIFIFAQSNLYHPQNHKRVSISQEIAQQANIETYEVVLKGKNKLAQSLEFIAIAGFAGLYLSVLEGIDPSPIPFVEKFKKMIN